MKNRPNVTISHNYTRRLSGPMKIRRVITMEKKVIIGMADGKTGILGIVCRVRKIIHQNNRIHFST